MKHLYQSPQGSGSITKKQAKRTKGPEDEDECCEILASGLDVAIALMNPCGSSVCLHKTKPVRKLEWDTGAPKTPSFTKEPH